MVTAIFADRTREQVFWRPGPATIPAAADLAYCRLDVDAQRSGVHVEQVKKFAAGDPICVLLETGLVDAVGGSAPELPRTGD
jgi:hypothetical protein